MANRLYRLPPCPDCDIEGNQSWLEDMARQGWLLTDDSFFLGTAVFEKAVPQTLRYRLEATKLQATLFNGADRPDEDVVQTNREFGWEYVTRRGQFYIYRCADPAAPELNTDPQVQAISVHALTKRIRSDLIGSILGGLFLMWLHRGFYLTLLCAMLGTLMMAAGMAMVVMHIAGRIQNALRLSRLRKRLQQGEPLTETTDWRRGKWRYRLFSLMLAVLPAVWIVAVLLQIPTQVKLEDHEGALPVTAEHIVAGATTDSSFLDSRVSFYEDILFPEGYELRQYIDYPTADGTGSGSFYIHYHRAAAPFLAQRIAYEYEHYFDRERAFEKEQREYIDLGDVGADYAACYREEYTSFLCLTKGTQTLYIRWWFYDDAGMTERDVALAALAALE